MAQSRRRNFITAAAAVLAIAAICFAWSRLRMSIPGADGSQAIREAVMSRAMQCYVIEGAYPESLEYLTENYGLTVNTDDYSVVYIAFAENLPPEIKVSRRDPNER